MTVPMLCNVALFSGGIDSAVAASLTGSDLYLLSVNYQQVMRRELASAAALSAWLGPVEHRTVEMRGFREVSKSARTDESLIEFDRRGLSDGYVPSAYPPGRDFTFISIATAWAETIVLAEPDRYDGAKIIIGTNYTDSLDYPDCQESVYQQFSALLSSSLKMCRVLGKTISVEAPLIGLTKQEVVKLGSERGVPFGSTWSCYQGGEKACGRCDACRIRYFAFSDSGLIDPLAYEITDVNRLEFADPRQSARQAARV
jgi:7-cyano-7-deazaguanine synthase